QTGQAQNRFYTDLEDWLATPVPQLGADSASGSAARPVLVGELRAAIERLRETLGDASGGKQATSAIVNLAESLQGLIHHMRSEQQMIRDGVDAQARQHRTIPNVLKIFVEKP